MASDNPREGQPQELETARRAMRAYAKGRSMEEWRANIEREITGRMPFPNKVAEAHYTDRRWNGLGLYAHFAQQAMKMLRDEYLSDRDFVAHRWGLPACKVSAEGLHVRVRPGTTGIPEHLFGCPIIVEYVDLPSQADVAAVGSEVMSAVERLRSQQPGCILGWSPEHVRVEAWAVPVAEKLHQQFGDLVELIVGALRYPPSRQPGPAPRRSHEEFIPEDVRLELDGPAVVRSGHTLHHDLVIRNSIDRDVWLAFGNRNAVVVDPRTGEVVGGYAGAVTDPLHIRRVPPEQTGRVPLLIGTASFSPQLGYALPPGDWGVQGLLRVVPDTRGPDRPMLIPPPDSPHPPMPRPPDTRGPDQCTPILPLVNDHPVNRTAQRRSLTVSRAQAPLIPASGY